MMFDDAMSCMLCAEDMGDSLLPAFGECNHRGVCSVCFVRMRSLLRDYSCPICKRDLDKVVCSSTVQDYQELSIWGTDAGAMFIFDEKSKMFFPRKYHREKITPLWLSRCRLCDVVKRDADQLRKHVISAHNMMMCQLCINNLQSFPSEFKIYSMAEYDNHLKNSDNCGSQGHPSCEFCKKRYYDKNALFMHLHVDHFTCHICEKQGTKFKYYQNYKSLESHFRRDHCICEDPSCLQKRFIVFGTEVELTSHRMQWHPTLMISRNVPITFRSYRERQQGSNSVTHEEYIPIAEPSDRQRRNGEFDGGIAGSANNGEWQLELQNPVAGANSERVGASATPSSVAVGAAPVPPSATGGMDPTWPVNAARSSGKSDFPGLDGSRGGRKQGGAVLGNWGKATSKHSAKPQVIKPKGNPVPAPHPKDMKVSAAAKPTQAQPSTAIAAAIQSSATPMFEEKRSAMKGSASQVSNSAATAARISKFDDGLADLVNSSKKLAIAEPDYPPLPASSKSTSTARSSDRSINNATGKPNISVAMLVDDYPTLPKAPPPSAKAASMQDKKAYPPLPPSVGGSSVKAVLASKPPATASGTAHKPFSAANLANPVEAPKKPIPAFSNTVTDTAEYPALPSKMKMALKGEKNPVSIDDSAAAFRAMRSSALGVSSSKPIAKKSTQTFPSSYVAGTPSTAVRGPVHDRPAEDYPALSIRIGLPVSNSVNAGKPQAQSKSTSKKQQKQELKKLAFNMK